MNFLKGESGQAAVLMALVMGILILGFAAFALDIGFMFHEKRRAQAAADAAAIAAAEEYAYGNSSAAAQAAANAIAKLNGFDPTLAKNPATVILNVPPASGNYANSSNNAYVEADVSMPIPTFFLAAVNSSESKMTVSARAVAGGGQSSPTCICLERATGMDLNMSNASQITAANCNITVDSSSNNAVGVVGSAGISVPLMGTISTTWDNSNNINNNGTLNSTKVITGISTSCAPPMPAVPTYSTCANDPLPGGGGNSYTVGPSSSSGTACYKALTVDGNGNTVTLNPGNYVINGGELHFESGLNRGGNGVFFYLVNGASVVIDNGANVNLVAQSTGTYAGILFFEDSGDSQPMSIQGGASSVFNGEILAPAAAVTLGNGSGTTIDAEIAAQSLTMNGGGTLHSTAVTNLGTLNTSVAKVTE